MATQSVIDPVQRSHSRKALIPEEILKVLKIASESKRNLAMILWLIVTGCVRVKFATCDCRPGF
jgi:integrase